MSRRRISSGVAGRPRPKRAGPGAALAGGDDWADVPQYFLEVDGAPVTLALYGRGDEHLAPRARPEAEGPQRARLAEVEALLGP